MTSSFSEFSLDDNSSRCLENKIQTLKKSFSFQIDITEPIDELGQLKLRVKYPISKFSQQIPKPQQTQAKFNLNQHFQSFFKLNKPPPNYLQHKKLLKLVRQGTPQVYRSTVYKYYLSNDYNYEFYLSQPIDQKVLDQISNDIDRTHPLIANFNTEVNLQALFRILKAQSARLPELGYIQGMNFIAGIFLMFLSESEAFGCFAGLVDKIKMIWSNNLQGANTLAQYALNIIKPLNSNLFKYLEAYSLQSTFSTFFLSFYQTFLPFKISLRIFDQIVAEGYKGLVRPAIALAMHAAKGLICYDPDFEKWFNQLTLTQRLNGISIINMDVVNAQQHLRLIGYSIQEQNFQNEILKVKLSSASVNEFMNK
ncbi:Rab-GTPase-TBC domain-containing protein [Spironucleus salmonicida]|uniref:Plant adhesion molecule 1 n=1 Tax=Spironucleus salmonicida TaxID=348837 RepID=V6LMJ0_9EUKA|nr:Rab-GTPase-TBC domain-containing protein [Spironucleus salmonicida]|eukprot:EST41929.1 Plant adhesion molecule 1 [Spironucleus salmonicida]